MFTWGYAKVLFASLTTGVVIMLAVSAWQLRHRGDRAVFWLFIHVAFLAGYRNRAGAVLSWWLAFTRDVRRERTFTTHQIDTLRDVYAPPGPHQT